MVLRREDVVGPDPDLALMERRIDYYLINWRTLHGRREAGPPGICEFSLDAHDDSLWLVVDFVDETARRILARKYKDAGWQVRGYSVGCIFIKVL